MAKRPVSFDDLIAASEPATETVELTDKISVIVRELSGRERFEFSSFADTQVWNTYAWLTFTGLVEPKFETVEDVDKLKPEWTVQIAAVVMRLSGIHADAEEDAEKKSEGTTDIGSGSPAISVAQ